MHRVPSDADKKTDWIRECNEHEAALKKFIGKSTWYNPAGQLVDFHERPNDFPAPFTELKILDITANCSAHDPANETDRYWYQLPPDHGQVIFSVSSGREELENLDLLRLNCSEQF